MTFSMPLSGDSRPKVRSTRLALDAELILAAAGERQVRDAVRDEVDLGSGTPYDLAEELGAVRAHDDEALREPR